MNSIRISILSFVSSFRLRLQDDDIEMFAGMNSGGFATTGVAVMAFFMGIVALTSLQAIFAGRSFRIAALEVSLGALS